MDDMPIFSLHSCFIWDQKGFQFFSNESHTMLLTQSRCDCLKHCFEACFHHWYLRNMLVFLFYFEAQNWAASRFFESFFTSCVIQEYYFVDLESLDGTNLSSICCKKCSIEVPFSFRETSFKFIEKLGHVAVIYYIQVHIDWPSRLYIEASPIIHHPSVRATICINETYEFMNAIMHVKE